MLSGIQLRYNSQKLNLDLHISSIVFNIFAVDKIQIFI